MVELECQRDGGRAERGERERAASTWFDFLMESPTQLLNCETNHILPSFEASAIKNYITLEDCLCIKSSLQKFRRKLFS